jgi:hypothetical protein
MPCRDPEEVTFQRGQTIVSSTFATNRLMADLPGHGPTMVPILQAGKLSDIRMPSRGGLPTRAVCTDQP